MGACASILKAMKAKPTNDGVPSPQPPNEDFSATFPPKKKLEDGDHANKHEEKALEVDAPQEEKSEEPKPKAPAPLQAEAAAVDKITEATE